MHANINYSHHNHRKLEKIINQQKLNHLNSNKKNNIYIMSKNDMKLKENNIFNHKQVLIKENPHFIDLTHFHR